MEEQKNRMTNERDYKQVHGYTAPDKEKEELIKRLGEMITDRYAVKLTHSMQTDDPEYWALDEVLTKEEATALAAGLEAKRDLAVEKISAAFGLKPIVKPELEIVDLSRRQSCRKNSMER